MIIRTKEGYLVAAGRLGRDAESQTVGVKATPKTTFSVLVKSEQDKPGEWLNCVAWRDLAEAAAFLHKGDAVIVCGKEQTRSYDTANGEHKTITECVCDGITRSMSLNAAPVMKVADDNPDPHYLVDMDDTDEDLPF